MDFIELKKRLAELDAACICDVNKNLRVMDPGIRPINQGLKMIGIAHTVHCKGDFLSVLKALHEADEEEILVVDAEGDKIALAGELFAFEAQRKNLAGIVVDGGCRDIKGIKKTSLPVYARYITPLAGTASKIFQTQVKIDCGGVAVEPGDVIFGDDDGVVVMNVEEIKKILATAENIQRIENKVLKKMEEGKSLVDLLNFHDHYAKISKKQKSDLIFII
jgi:4-hydroxy-4-methyl-2-oxoglutarate aldolase